MPKTYQPDQETLRKYADVLVFWALRHGKGIRKGDVVNVTVPESAKPMYAPLRNAVLKAGGIPIMDYRAQDVQEADAYNLASPEQLTYFPAQYMKGLLREFDHSISIIAEHDKYVLEEVPAEQIIARTNAYRPYSEWRQAKEARGKFTWTLALYGTEAMAEDVGMSIKEYWQEIIKACYLDAPDPIKKWKETQKELERLRKALNDLAIESVHVKGEDIDLRVKLGPNRSWLGGSGANIPSFELFISPDWRGTEGTVYFNQPLFRYGKMVKDISLEFKKGRVVSARASVNKPLLEEIVASTNGDKIGEFSLTDGRLSRITKLMGETLYDENIGGLQGNTHIALGNAYKDSYPGNAAAVTDQNWEEMGYNSSPQHVDLISTARRTVTATLPNGNQTIIYKDGVFTI